MTDSVVCVVDDDDSVRTSLRALLEMEGFRVEDYPSATAFLEADACARCSCLVLDIHMPGMTGLELQEHLAHAGIDLPIIMLTGRADVPGAVRALKAGALEFLEKPCDDKVLLDSVRRAVSQRKRTLSRAAKRHIVAQRYATLTPREREVMAEMLSGQPTKVIAHHLGASPRTVEVHRARIMQKMQARNLSELIRMALETGIGPKTI